MGHWNVLNDEEADSSTDEVRREPPDSTEFGGVLYEDEEDSSEGGCFYI